METSNTPVQSRKAHWGPIGKGLLVLLAVSVFGVWLVLTPSGLLGKADAIGYAVCHRIAVRSFFLGDRQIPLCARCSGMYIGMLVGILYQLHYGRRGKIPPLKISIPLSIFFITFGVDGLNSYLQFFPQAPYLYPSQNWLRLATGVGMGLLVALIVLPIFNQTFWRVYEDRPALEKWSQVPALLLIAALCGLAIYGQNPILLFPLALLSAATVPLVLSLCYALLWVIFFHKENTFKSWKDGWVPMLAGLTTAMLQIGLVDLLRFSLTHTWAGFTLG